jgi:hypothetical protein
VLLLWSVDFLKWIDSRAERASRQPHQSGCVEVLRDD